MPPFVSKLVQLKEIFHDCLLTDCAPLFIKDQQMMNEIIPCGAFC